MRRTFLTVLVLAGVFVTTPRRAPAMQTQAGPNAAAAASPARSSVRTRLPTAYVRRKSPRRTAAHAAGRRHVRTSGCPAVRRASHRVRHGTVRKTRALAGTPGAVAEQALRPRPVDTPGTRETQRQNSSIVETDAPQRVDSKPAPSPVAQPAFLTRKRAAMPPPMRGSLTSLERQNDKAVAEGLERIEDEDDLSDRIARKLLVPIPVSAALTVNGYLPEHHRYCRPWTARFLSDLARAHAALFHGSLEVSSAVRTVEYQKRLMAVNGNAAAAEGDVVSPHLTGATIDIAKSGLTRQEIGWMRYWLQPLQTAGKIDVEEEFQQACFHITVYKSYAPARPAGSIARAKPGQPGVPKAIPSKARQAERDVASATPALGR